MQAGEKPGAAKGVFQWTEVALLRAGVRYLQRYPASRKHFVQVMQRKIERTLAKGADREQPYAQWLESVAQRCERMGLLDDLALARALGRSLHGRGVPQRGIRQRMLRKGLVEQDIDTVLNAMNQGEVSPDWTAALAYARRRRLGPFGPAESRGENYRKDLQKLARRGFGFEVAKGVLCHEPGRDEDEDQDEGTRPGS